MLPTSLLFSVILQAAQAIYLYSFQQQRKYCVKIKHGVEKKIEVVYGRNSRTFDRHLEKSTSRLLGLPVESQESQTRLFKRENNLI